MSSTCPVDLIWSVNGLVPHLPGFGISQSPKLSAAVGAGIIPTQLLLGRPVTTATEDQIGKKVGKAQMRELRWRPKKQHKGGL